MAAKKAKKGQRGTEEPRTAAVRLQDALERLWRVAGGWAIQSTEPAAPTPTLADAGGSPARLLEMIEQLVKEEMAKAKRVTWAELNAEVRDAAEALAPLAKGLKVDPTPLHELSIAMRRAHAFKPDDAAWLAAQRAGALTVAVLDAIPAPIGAKPLDDLHRTLWEELLRVGGTHGCLSSDIKVKGLTPRTRYRRLVDLKAQGHAELMPSRTKPDCPGRHWRAIGEGPP